MKMVWFRKDLRIKDNHALTRACQSNEPVIAIYFATPKQWQNHACAPIQIDLIHRRLLILKQELEVLNIPLLIYTVPYFIDTHDTLINLCQKYQITDVYCTKEYEFNELDRDNAIAGRLSLTGTMLHSYEQKSLLAPNAVKTGDGKPYRIFTPFKHAYLKAMLQTDLVPIGAPLPVMPNRETQLLLQKNHNKEFDFRYPRRDSIDWPVDDRTILQRLHDFCSFRITQYHTDRDFPSCHGTSLLSPYLAIGALSPRQCFARLLTEHPHVLCEQKTGPSVWLSELIWRDFYQQISAHNAMISKGKTFIPWMDSIEWQRNDLLFERWKQGKTGFPIIDAAMRQLKEIGWMHNRLRMVVASFLVKDLHIDWRWGERYFLSQLIDGDFASNNGGWQWCASTGADAQPYFRIMNPHLQSKRFDPKGRFIRAWVQELSPLPEHALHEPHSWAAKQNMTLNYFKPVVDHNLASKRAVALFKQAKAKEKQLLLKSEA